MRRATGTVAGGILLLVVWQPAASEAGALGRLLGRGATKAPISHAAPKPHVNPKPARPTDVLKQDLKNHRAVPVRPLDKNRTVFRFTTKEEAREAQRKGLPPGAHMTAHGGPGRTATPDHAQSRYATPSKPGARITVHLPKRQPVRSNKIAGAPDQRLHELTSPERVPPSSIAGVTPLKPKGR